MSLPCLTKVEAARKFAGQRLYWHSSARCWDATPVGAATRGRYAPPPLRRGAAETAAPELAPAEIAFPAVVVVDHIPAARGPGWSYVPWFSPRPMTGWPLVYDFDAPETFVPWKRRIE